MSWEVVELICSKMWPMARGERPRWAKSEWSRAPERMEERGVY